MKTILFSLLLVGGIFSTATANALSRTTLMQRPEDKHIDAFDADKTPIRGLQDSCYVCSSPCSSAVCCHGRYPQCCSDGVYCYCCRD
ncbi:hypothetical protein ASPACDRAFT_121756 [Aspergillus aculeatus ATCC 16872]|uniref:Uncharacterized protein n=1 Tax=Aspergillus aculeatus (strain ATCC 16872 / CBS 172.66 / WB 5094) TaxID=690307 RepID=A0A1L9WS06_ASPA1|nr:uncharacterized protein ASPACDRAFT_121756 [Aspergillus aculeatus ATCC 16872]OJJ98975.1 hypothetical protein ASPACDRAFT_121756 [Aspergillus aculeatus ATCC 16872]